MDTEELEEIAKRWACRGEEAGCMTHPVLSTSHGERCPKWYDTSNDIPRMLTELRRGLTPTPEET